MRVYFSQNSTLEFKIINASVSRRSKSSAHLVQNMLLTDMFSCPMRGVLDPYHHDKVFFFVGVCSVDPSTRENRVCSVDPSTLPNLVVVGIRYQDPDPLMGLELLGDLFNLRAVTFSTFVTFATFFSRWPASSSAFSMHLRLPSL